MNSSTSSKGNTEVKKWWGNICPQERGNLVTFIYKDGDSKQNIIITIDNVKRIDENSPWIGMDFSIETPTLHTTNPSP